MPFALDLMFVVLAAIFIVVGVRKGFIRSLIQSAKFILSIVAMYFLGSHVATFLKDKFLFKSIYNSVHSFVNNIYENSTASMNSEEILSSFPQFMVNDEVRAQVESSIADAEQSGAALVETISNNIANPVAVVLSNILGYVLTFVLALIILSIAAWLLTKLADRSEFIGKANRIFGGIWGALMGTIVLFMIASIIKFFDANGVIYQDTAVVKFFGDSILLEIFKIINIGSMLAG
jgi:uncharacterized membrane protein required for colicin V production